jgi:hypothetical protein
MIPTLGTIMEWIIAIILLRFFWLEAPGSGSRQPVPVLQKGE